MKKLYVKISKFLSFILRHNPDKYDLELDSEGFTYLKAVIKILDDRYKDIKITKHTIEEIIRESDKKRFDIVGNKIKAFYGHSINQKIKMTEVISLPTKLYHGTNLKAYEKIQIEGVAKKSRQYVHLSDNIKTALIVGKRRTDNPIILVIDVDAAQKEGIKFYKSGDMYLADYIPPNCIIKLNN